MLPECGVDCKAEFRFGELDAKEVRAVEICAKYQGAIAKITELNAWFGVIVYVRHIRHALQEHFFDQPGVGAIGHAHFHMKASGRVLVAPIDHAFVSQLAVGQNDGDVIACQNLGRSESDFAHLADEVVDLNDVSGGDAAFGQ